MKKIIEFLDKRLHPRRDVSIPITFMIVKGKSANVTEYHKGTVINLSGEGCCLFIDRLSYDGFYLMKCIEESELYNIKVKSEHGEILGKICWINTHSDGPAHGFKIGVETAGENIRNWII